MVSLVPGTSFLNSFSFLYNFVKCFVIKAVGVRAGQKGLGGGTKGGNYFKEGMWVGWDKVGGTMIAAEDVADANIGCLGGGVFDVNEGCHLNTVISLKGREGEAMVNVLKDVGAVELSCFEVLDKVLLDCVLYIHVGSL